MTQSSNRVAFTGRILMLGCGSVGQCTLPLILRHVDMPADRITVMDFEDVRPRIADSLAAGVVLKRQRLTQANYQAEPEPGVAVVVLVVVVVAAAAAAGVVCAASAAAAARVEVGVAGALVVAAAVVVIVAVGGVVAASASGSSAGRARRFKWQQCISRTRHRWESQFASTAVAAAVAKRSAAAPIDAQQPRQNDAILAVLPVVSGR